jgi:nucleoside-diphosphate-sugar epimerase
MTDALVGHTGFVGSNLLRQHEFGARYNSKNIEEIRGQSFDTLVFSGAQAVKWWANQNPDEDWARIEAALGPMRDVRAEQVVLMSTVDVLPNIAGATEETDCHAFDCHAYGTHRLRLEDEFRSLFDPLTIVRLPALFGAGLKKNVIFDLLNDNILEKIAPKSRFQYYDLDGLWADIEQVVAAGIELIHLFPEPVETGEIVAAFFPDLEIGTDPLPVATYELATRHDELFGRNDGYIYGRNEVLARLGRFIEATRRGESG